MLLPFRWLLYGAAAAPAAEATAAHKDEKLLRRIQRRLTRWSEAVAPPRVGVAIQGAAIPQLRPAVASGALTITRHVAVYNKGPAIAAASLAAFTGVDVSVESKKEELGIKNAEIKSGELVADIDLFEEEYLMLIAA